ncbi:DUF2637 domain-containing protein [Streptomyces sp. NPDC051214]|uniref:DUF2637 domain-containing protein n=1 Tax=Streptomyces sp. NPDC051214 TaxID=3155282 RepID=UPI00342A32BF
MPVVLSRVQRILIGVVVAGAVVIAGIGFAGSYAAVRELAEKKGFGSFSAVFPIGIDAGICVLLALDLLLTWIRIPFPLLRQTAWLLTAATIAFNGAAAWPDPLGVGMHAVIPVLFVVAVEAARHAVGRIADITADKHMEGVRLTRWLLSPGPTFKLWRRMKLWEIRSYEQVIKLEQDRLIYQARLQARYGRNWRRKAPVESLMPLRLVRFGVPLSETGPAGLAAAGIDTPGQQNATHETVSVEVQQPAAQRFLTPRPDAGEERLPLGPPQKPHALLAGHDQGGAASELTEDDGSYPEAYFRAYLGFASQIGVYPTPHQFARYLMDTHGITQPGGAPLDDEQLLPMTLAFEQRDAGRSLLPAEATKPREDDHTQWAQFYRDTARQHAAENGQLSDVTALDSFLAERFGLTAASGHALDAEMLAGHLDTNAAEAAPTGAEEQPDHAAELTADTSMAEQDDRRAPDPEQRVRSRSVHAPIPDDEELPASAGPANAPPLTTVDRYYLAWLDYQTTHGHEPSDKELSAFLADRGVTGRNRARVDPSTLRRYLPQFRIYVVWAAERQHTEQPRIADVVQQLANQGVQKRHIKDPAKAAWREDEVRAMVRQADFERRYQAVIAHNASFTS